MLARLFAAAPRLAPILTELFTSPPKLRAWVCSCMEMFGRLLRLCEGVAPTSRLPPTSDGSGGTDSAGAELIIKCQHLVPNDGRLM